MKLLHVNVLLGAVNQESPEHERARRAEFEALRV